MNNRALKWALAADNIHLIFCFSLYCVSIEDQIERGFSTNVFAMHSYYNSTSVCSYNTHGFPL